MRLMPLARTSTLVTAMIVMALLAPASMAAAAQAPGTAGALQCKAVAHHENAVHNGLSCTTLPASPAQKWSVTLNGDASYPIIANGKVFVATAGPPAFLCTSSP